jgi:hypothetical protein
MSVFFVLPRSGPLTSVSTFPRMGVPADHETQLRYSIREVERARYLWAAGLESAWLAAGLLLVLLWGTTGNFYSLVAWVVVYFGGPMTRLVVPKSRSMVFRRFLGRTATGASPHLYDVFISHWVGDLYHKPRKHAFAPLAGEGILDTLVRVFDTPDK